MTHRGLSSAFMVVSAHDEAAFESATEGLAPNRVTLVVLMGLARSAAIAWRLVDAGWARRTPVAVVRDASTPRQQVWRGSLDDLAESRLTIDPRAAGTIIVGDVVNVGIAAAVGRASNPGTRPRRDAGRPVDGRASGGTRSCLW